MTVLAGILCLVPAALAGCIVNLDKALQNKFPPLLLQDNAFVFPTSKNEKKENILTIDEGDHLRLYCHSLNSSEVGRNAQYLNISKKIKLEKSYDATLKCLGHRFYLDGTQTKVNVESVTCSTRQQPRITREPASCSPVGADRRKTKLDTLVKATIGWNITGTFIEQISLCIDEKIFATIWTKHTIRGANILYQDKGSRVDFRVDNEKKMRFFKWKKTDKKSASTSFVDDLYKRINEKVEIKKLLGTNTYKGKPIVDPNKRSTIYFARGHLAPDADFVYDVMQHATYFFINVAPQFQSFNGGNWKALEINSRDYAAKVGRNITVYTGTHDILKYPNARGRSTRIYLYNSTYVPAPKYYWKVLQDPKDNSAVAFIGLNNPHADKRPRHLCPNRCEEMPWVDWNIEDLNSGYMYCCDVDEARKAIPTIPSILPGGLLGTNAEETPDNDNGSNTCSAGPCTCTCLPVGNNYTCTCTC